MHSFKFIALGGIIIVCLLVYAGYLLTGKDAVKVTEYTPLESLSAVKEEYLTCIAHEDTEEIAVCLDVMAGSAYGTFPTKDIARELDSLTQQEKDRWCHEVMHYMGWKAYETEQDIAKAFLNSSELCDSGMYHGVMEEFLRREGLSENIPTLVRTVCTDSLQTHPNASDGILSLCYHGLGHGLMYITSSDLKASLEYCDALDHPDSETCYSGAFMEFNTSKDIGPLANKRDLTDFSYCSDLNKEHIETCYFRQGLNNFSATNGDVKSAMELCLNVPEEFHAGCFEGVGSNNPAPGKSHSDSARACEGALEVSEVAYEKCISGSLGFVLQLEWGDMAKAYEFCEAVEDQYKTYCYASAGSNIIPWLTQTETKEQKCSIFPIDAQEACIMGGTQQQ